MSRQDKIYKMREVVLHWLLTYLFCEVNIKIKIQIIIWKKENEPT